jgi:hypothetical protein
MFCVHCGVENPEIGRFCRSCGKALIANTGLSQERLYTTDVLASEDTHPNTQEAVRSSTLPSPRSSERLDETVEAMNEQTAVRAALWIVGGVVGFILLVISIAISARLPEEHQRQTEDRRAAYTARVDSWLKHQWGTGAHHSGGTLTLIYGVDQAVSDSAMACIAAQLRVPPYFNELRVVTYKFETDSLKVLATASLPMSTPLPEGCSLPPAGLFGE